MKKLGGTILATLPLLAAVFSVQPAHAVGSWLELTPIGGVEIDETTGERRPALEARLDAIERECADGPKLRG